MMVPAFIGGFGPMELGLILALFILLFGASKLPEVARSSGLAMGEFQKGRLEVEDELEEMRNGKSSEVESGESDAEVTAE